MVDGRRRRRRWWRRRRRRRVLAVQQQLVVVVMQTTVRRPRRRIEHVTQRHEGIGRRRRRRKERRQSVVETTQKFIPQEGAVEQRRVRRRRRRRRSGHRSGACRRRRRRQQFAVEVEIGGMAVAAAFRREGSGAAIYRALVHQFQMDILVVRLDSEMILEDFTAGGATARILLVDGHLIVVSGQNSIRQCGCVRHLRAAIVVVHPVGQVVFVHVFKSRRTQRIRMDHRHVAGSAGSAVNVRMRFRRRRTGFRKA